MHYLKLAQVIVNDFFFQDPYMRKRNVAKSVSHPHIYEYIDDRLRAAYLYFGNPQTKGGALLTLHDVGQLRKKLHENLKHMHDLSQNSTSSPGLTKSTDADLISRDENRELKSNISEIKCVASSVCGKFEDFADRIGKSVLDSAISTLSNHFHPATTEKDDEEILETRMSSLSVEDSVESSENLGGLRTASTDTDSEHSEGEDSIDCEDSEESEESGGMCGDELEIKEAVEADADLNSLTKTKYNGGIEGLYDESLVHGLQEDDFNYKFDADVLYDGEVFLKNLM